MAMAQTSGEWLKLEMPPLWLKSAEINLPRIRKDNGLANSYQFWLRTMPRTEKGFTKPHDHAMTLYRANCDERTLGALSTAEYDDVGRSIRSSNTPWIMGNPVPPNSFGERLVDTICAMVEKPLSKPGAFGDLSRPDAGFLK